jgi:uncharacterized protein (TIGR00725 family)
MRNATAPRIMKNTGCRSISREEDAVMLSKNSVPPVLQVFPNPSTASADRSTASANPSTASANPSTASANPSTESANPNSENANLFAAIDTLPFDGTLRHRAAQLLEQQLSYDRVRQPVSVVGPREATEAQLACAFRVGCVLGAVRIPVVCGGKHGVMAAVSKGVSRSGGLVIGLLPEGDTSLANPHLTVALPTGLGITRNALVARVARLMIAIGGGLGTTSEIALALQWGTPVFSMHDAPQVPGHRRFDNESGLFAAVFDALIQVKD